MVSDEIQDIIAHLDQSGNGEINYTEFLAATIRSRVKITREHLWSVFKVFDLDDTGFISEENLHDVMAKTGKELSHDEL
jgi:calcium-dependent protein kinase